MMQSMFRAVIRGLASWKLTILLAVAVAAVFACGAYLETSRGREWVQWHIYGSRWLLGLLSALGIDIVVATLARRPWRWSQPGLVVAPMGGLVLVAGLIQTHFQEIEGLLVLRAGESASEMLRTQRSQLTLLSRSGQEVESAEFGFSAGPSNWPEERTLDFGEVDGTAIKVLKFYRHARFQVEWNPDEAGKGEPALQFAVSDAQGESSQPRWCIPIVFDNSDIQIHQTGAPTLLEYFLHPPSVKSGGRGVVSAHYQNRVFPIQVDDNLGKKVPLGDSGLTVEIVEYYANSMRKKDQFISVGTEPKNPMLQLRVHVPGQEQPTEEIAYAGQPFVNYETIRKQPCPVKFWYQHPDVPARPGTEFLQTPDGKLYCRSGIAGTYQPRGEVKEGDQISLPDGRQITLLRHVPHARKENAFTPLDRAEGEATGAEAAAQVEVTSDGKSTRFWLGRNNLQLGVHSLEAPGGSRLILFGYEKAPLGLTVKMAGFDWEGDPHASDDGGFFSQIQIAERAEALTDSDNGLAWRLTARQPVRYGSFTFSQGGFQLLPDKTELAMVRVTNDPGRLCKYTGGVLMALGLLLLGYVRIATRRKRRAGAATPAAEGENREPDAATLPS